jgi:hypothetical protein
MGKTLGVTPTQDALRRQWRHWLEHEFLPVRRSGIDAYHLTSNHNTFNRGSEAVFREVFPEIPANGPAEDMGLSYTVLRDDRLLLVFTNSASSRLGVGHVETEWLSAVLARHRSVPCKLVLGHYPVLPVNGYTRYPRWRIEPRSGDALWRLLVEHGVMAYVCSHVIAFDTRAKDGVLQICSAGAGTRYGPSGGFMRGPDQFFHFVDCTLTDAGMSLTAIDETGKARAHLSWPAAGADGDDGARRIPLGRQPQELVSGSLALSSRSRPVERRCRGRRLVARPWSAASTMTRGRRPFGSESRARISS